MDPDQSSIKTAEMAFSGNNHSKFLQFWISCFFFVLLPRIISANPDSTIILTPTDHPDITLISLKEYKGKALWGYMNGGADLYHECGFVALLTEELEFQGEKMKIEVYQMRSPAGALAAYTHNRLKCPEQLGSILFSCCSPYQTQFVKGHFYCSLTRLQGTETAGKAVKDAGWMLYEKIILQYESTLLPEIFQNPALSPSIHNLSVLMGPLTAQDLFSAWTDAFGDYPGLVLYHLPITIQDFPSDAFVLIFPAADQCQPFLENRKNECESEQQEIFLELPSDQLSSASCELFHIRSQAQQNMIEDFLQQIALPGK